jgi:hypothetical protein
LDLPPIHRDRAAGYQRVHGHGGSPPGYHRGLHRRSAGTTASRIESGSLVSCFQASLRSFGENGFTRCWHRFSPCCSCFTSRCCSGGCSFSMVDMILLMSGTRLVTTGLRFQRSRKRGMLEGANNFAKVTEIISFFPPFLDHILWPANGMCRIRWCDLANNQEIVQHPHRSEFLLNCRLGTGKSSIQAATWNGRTVVSSRP